MIYGKNLPIPTVPVVIKVDDDKLGTWKLPVNVELELYRVDITV